MKVLHVINSLGGGGAERSLAEMLPGLRARGVHNEVVVLRSAPEGVDAEIRSNGFPIHGISGPGLARQLTMLIGLIRAVRPDVVHTTLFEADILGRTAGFFTQTPVITSLVNTSYTTERRADPNIRAWALEATRQLDGWTARHLTVHLHAISNAVREAAVRDLGVDGSSVTVVPRGRSRARLGTNSPQRRARCRERFDIGPHQVVLLNVGRHEYQKGQRYLIDAMPRLVDGYPDVLLVQTGRNGNESQRLQEQVRRLGLEGHVRFYGHRPDLPDLLCAADVFAFPSLYEGLGGALLEAMALEIPIVATDIPAISELLDSGRCGTLVRTGDARALADAVEQVLTNPDGTRRLTTAALQRFRNHYDLDEVLDATVALYEDVLVARRGATGVAA